MNCTKGRPQDRGCEPGISKGAPAFRYWSKPAVNDPGEAKTEVADAINRVRPGSDWGVQLLSKGHDRSSHSIHGQACNRLPGSPKCDHENSSTRASSLAPGRVLPSDASRSMRATEFGRPGERSGSSGRSSIGFSTVPVVGDGSITATRSRTLEMMSNWEGKLRRMMSAGRWQTLNAGAVESQ